MQLLRSLIPAFFLLAAMVASSQPATASDVRLVATIEGQGRAVMDAGGPLTGDTTYFIHVRLYSDGTAVGSFDCVDLPGSTFPGDFSGPITSWTMVGGNVVLSGRGELHSLSGALLFADIPYSVGIQAYGGAGQGHWTLILPDFGGLLCSEVLTSGKLVMAGPRR